MISTCDFHGTTSPDDLILQTSFPDKAQKAEYILVYKTGRRDKHDKHCIFVKSVINGYFNCINSWGDYEPEPKVPIGQEGNRLWKVIVDYRTDAPKESK